MINTALLTDVRALHGSFASARPFKHLCIDDFLQPAEAEAALAEFPSFQRDYALNEFGQVGGKAVRTRLAEIGPFYRRLHAYLNSSDFLGFISTLTGIEDLRTDPDYYGGGTHENLHGQELDPHIDFNYDPRLKMHRRLNLLVYLNKDWNPDWGGCIDLHSNPRRPDEDRISSFTPLFNRAVVFETNEVSWHGFRQIQLPEDRRDLSRKCISIYLYTLDRPRGEVAPSHGTFYVQRPLPARLVPGHRLSEQDMQQLHVLLKRRDDWIYQYAKRGQLRQPAAAPCADSDELAPLQCLAAEGQYADKWVGDRFWACVRAREHLVQIAIEGWVPDQWVEGLEIGWSINGVPAGALSFAPGVFQFVIPMDLDAGDERTLELRAQRQLRHRDTGGVDDRKLSFILASLRGIPDKQVQLPLASHIKAGHMLEAQDVAQLKDTLARRDRRIEAYQLQELVYNAG